MNYIRLKVNPQVSFRRSIDLHRNFCLHPTKSVLSISKPNGAKKMLYEICDKCHLGNSFKIPKQKLNFNINPMEISKFS